MAGKKIDQLKALLESEEIFVSSENGEIIENAIVLLSNGHEGDAEKVILDLLSDDNAEVPMELGDELASIF